MRKKQFRTCGFVMVACSYSFCFLAACSEFPELINRLLFKVTLHQEFSDFEKDQLY